MAPLFPEADNNSGGGVIVAVGRVSTGDFCCVPVTVEGVPCAALVDTGSTVTVVRPDVVPEGTSLEPTLVPLRTVTGELAPMTGRAVLSMTVGGESLRHMAWIAAVQDPCILGLDFLRASGCQLDLLRGTVSFYEGPVVTLFPKLSQDGHPGRIATIAAETVVVSPLPVLSSSAVSPLQSDSGHTTPDRDLPTPTPFLMASGGKRGKGGCSERDMEQKL